MIQALVLNTFQMKNTTSKNRIQRLIFAALIAALLIGWNFCSHDVMHFLGTNEKITSSSFIAPPVDNQHITVIERQPSGKKYPTAWFEALHKTAPGDDWRLIEAQSMQQLIHNRTQIKTSSFAGTWTERGPSNIPGRITDLDIDYLTQRLYALSDHGIVFRSSDLNGTQWEAMNDHFPLGLDVASQLKLIKGTSNVLISSGYIKSTNSWGVYRSADGGSNWVASAGIGSFPMSGIRRIVQDDVAIFLLVQEYNYAVPTDYFTIYKSSDQGLSFAVLYRTNIPTGDGGKHVKTDMWVSDETQSPLYFLQEDQLLLINKQTGARTFNSFVSGGTMNQSLLTGHSSDGVVNLTAYQALNDTGRFYRWSSLDQQWHYKGMLTQWHLALPFGSNSLSCSMQSPDTIYFGSILTSRSTDGGVGWTTIDLDPTGSYALYHGDVPKTLNSINPNTGEEETYMGTDGGIYKLDVVADHFNSVSIPGLNCTQIYKMVTKQSEPGKMFIGTQDNGYAHTSAGNFYPGTVPFNLQWGGDVTNVASGDGGETFWLWWLGDGCNYMSGPDENYVISTWSPYAHGGSIPYWEPPVWIPSQHPDRCYTAGYLNNTGGNYLIKLQAIPGADAVATTFPYNFEAQAGGRITAIAISPLDSSLYYVATDNGKLLRSTDAGMSWTSATLSNSLFPRVILPSKTNVGEPWVAGSGYSNSPVYFSSDNGQTFNALNIGIPSCLVEALATNEDESILFAATSIGPFALDRNQIGWTAIAGETAPLVHYMDVEYVSATATARFATYARGIWDFRLTSTGVHSVEKDRFVLKLYPNPTSDRLYVQNVDDFEGKDYQIVDLNGKVLQTGKIAQSSTVINISGLPSGVYFVKIAEVNKVEKFIIR
ncbi:MAG: hypothetical protein FD155_2587 [Bacteroidetes bacterium]|nr:MAG: hypothetical protein FD155_2587 [Bacteroidota bacterium]